MRFWDFPRGRFPGRGLPLLLRSSRRPIFAGALLAFISIAFAPVYADVPPGSYMQKGPINGAAAAIHKLQVDARNALAAGKTRLAVILLKNAVSAAPQNTEVRVQLGTALLRLGDEAEAERELRQARNDGAPPILVLPPLFQTMLVRNENQLLLDTFPDPGPAPPGAEAPDILIARAIALQKLERRQEADDAMNRSLALRRDGPGLLTRARMSLVEGDYAAAGRFVDEVIQNWPANTDAMLFKVELLLAEKDNDGALAVANRISSTFPGNLAGRFARVESFLRLNQDALAKAEIDSILAAHPDLIMAIYYKALLLARAGDSKGAWNVAQVLPGDFRDTNQGAAVIVAQMAINAGKADMGAAMLARILKDHPDDIAARIRLAELRLRQNGTTGALNVLEPLKDSTDPRVTRLYAMIYLQAHRPKDALDALRKLNAASAANLVEKRALALLEAQSGNVDQAVDILAPVAAKDPTNPIIVEPYIDVLIQKRRYKEALRVADKYGAVAAQQAKALAYRGTVLMMQHDISGAQSAFDKAVANDPRNTSALYTRALFLVSNQKFGDANRDLRAILALDSKNLAAVMKLAEIAVRQGNDAGVRSLYGRAIALAPDNATPRIALTLHLVSRNDVKGAFNTARDCASVQPNNADCLLLLGKAQATLGMKKEAVSSFRRLVLLKPGEASAQLLLSAAYLLAGDRTSAARALDAAVELDPQAEAVRRAQINYQIGAGNPKAAVELARDFQAANPGTASDLLLAESLERAKQNDEAAAILNKSLLKRADSLVFLQLIHLALVSNDKNRAGDLMSKWLATNPGDTATRMRYATLLLQQDEMAKAASQYQIVLKQSPDNIDALNNLSWLVQGSDPKRALALLTRASQLSPNSSHVCDSLGWLKLQRRDLPGGLALLTRAHGLEPGNPTITYHLIVALDANDKRKAALGLLKELLSSNVPFAEREKAAQLYSGWH